MSKSSMWGPRTVGAIAAVMALAGCTAPAPTIDPTASAAPSTTERAAAPRPDTSVPATADLAPHDAEVTPEPSAEETTLQVAADAVAAYCSPGLAKLDWLAGLYPYLTQQAAVAYETVDPSVVPCSSVTGPARLRDGDGAYTMRVIVPTDAGEYEAYVHRETAEKPWLVDRFTPPAG